MSDFVLIINDLCVFLLQQFLCSTFELRERKRGEGEEGKEGDRETDRRRYMDRWRMDGQMDNKQMDRQKTDRQRMRYVPYIAAAYPSWILICLLPSPIKHTPLVPGHVNAEYWHSLQSFQLLVSAAHISSLYSQGWSSLLAVSTAYSWLQQGPP